ncbi:MAG TPA: transposase [Ktedonobacteraceae bacterium]|nr:transposase [Ktedonobacteraceae bacterium]
MGLAQGTELELISRDRGTTFADGATRGAPQALQVADRWHILHNVGEALEKVLARHHTDLKRASASLLSTRLSVPRATLARKPLCAIT